MVVIMQVSLLIVFLIYVFPLSTVINTQSPNVIIFSASVHLWWTRLRPHHWRAFWYNVPEGRDGTVCSVCCILSCNDREYHAVWSRTPLVQWYLIFLVTSRVELIRGLTFSRWDFPQEQRRETQREWDNMNRKGQRQKSVKVKDNERKTESEQWVKVYQDHTLQLLILQTLKVI